MIDFHCHLDLYSDPKQVARECIDRKIYVLSVTTTPSAWVGTCQIHPDSKYIKTALGLHPQLAHERYAEIDLFGSQVKQARYIGEIGLDGAPEYSFSFKKQMDVFNSILRICANAGGRLMSIHSRRSSQLVLDCLKRQPESGVPILHWFSGSNHDLKCAIEMDCWFSVGPQMFVSQRGRQLIMNMPRNRIITETDGPFAQINGRPLFPWDVEFALNGLSEIWETPVSIVRQNIFNNFSELLRKMG